MIDALGIVFNIYSEVSSRPIPSQEQPPHHLINEFSIKEGLINPKKGKPPEIPILPSRRPGVISSVRSPINV
jgi:hypothetical protein